MIAERTGLAQVVESVASTGVEDTTLQTSTAKPGTVEFVAALVASEATTITVPEVPAMTSVLRNLPLALFLHLVSWLPPLWILYAPR